MAVGLFVHNAVFLGRRAVFSTHFVIIDVMLPKTLRAVRGGSSSWDVGQYLMEMVPIIGTNNMLNNLF